MDNILREVERAKIFYQKACYRWSKSTLEASRHPVRCAWRFRRESLGVDETNAWIFTYFHCEWSLHRCKFTNQSLHVRLNCTIYATRCFTVTRASWNLWYIYFAVERCFVRSDSKLRVRRCGVYSVHRYVCNYFGTFRCSNRKEQVFTGSTYNEWKNQF